MGNFVGCGQPLFVPEAHESVSSATASDAGMTRILGLASSVLSD